MDNSYTFAAINGKEELLSEITKLERDIASKTGQDIILIAYTKEGNR